MLFKKCRRVSPITDFDKTGKRPVIKSSICTGERVAGFKDEKTGQVQELMLIRDEKDLERFMQTYDVSSDEIEKIW